MKEQVLGFFFLSATNVQETEKISRKKDSLSICSRGSGGWLSVTRYSGGIK
jgi:hypothetical protein